MERLKGKTALITGCNRGIGKATAKKFAAEGANLICALRKANPNFEAETTAWTKEYGVDVDFIYFDLADEDSIKKAFKDLIRKKRSLDILVNNAAVPHGSLFIMTPLKIVKEVMQINFFSQILVTQLAAKIMMKQKSGSIINMSSITSLCNLPGWTSYGSSKAAIIGLTRTTASELAPFGIRVNAVAPGLIDTEMANAMHQKEQTEIIERSNLARKGKPEEVANLLCFLASDEASYITGQIIRIDGGL